MRRDTFLKSLAALAAAGALPNVAWANANLKMMIPANPGGGWDSTGRALGEAFRESKAADSVTFETRAVLPAPSAWPSFTTPTRVTRTR
jgi:putative tricarboxylic transport membrane protein